MKRWSICQIAYVETRYINHIDAPDLLVYKNKVSFDKRNNAKDERKEQPLKSSHILDNLGETEEEALIVIVPQPSQSSQQATQTPSFPPCKLPFFNNIHDVTEIDGQSLVSFGKNMPSTSLNRLYIHKCY